MHFRKSGNQSALTEIWSPDLFCSFIKDRSLTLKSRQYRPPTQKPSQSITLKKSISARTQVNFDPPHKKQISIPTLNKMKLNSISHTKIESISTPPVKWSETMPRHKNQVKLDPDTKTKYFSSPTHEKQVKSDPDTEIKSCLIPRTEIKSISTTHTKI